MYCVVLYQCVILILSGAMFKALFVLITVGCQLLIPLVEIGVNIWNIFSINQMILDPESGYGEEYFFDWLVEDPFADLVPASISECDYANIKSTKSRICSKPNHCLKLSKLMIQ